MEEIREKLKTRFLCREREVDLLGAHLGHNWASLLVFGQKGTGKTALVREMVDALELSYSWVNCLETYSTKLLFQTILLDFYRQTEAGREADLSEAFEQSHCSNQPEFIEKIAQINALKESESKEKHETATNSKTRNKYLIVMDFAEELINWDPSVLSFFSRLQELTSSFATICCLFISNLPSECFHTSGSFLFPWIEIEFKSYSKDNLIAILRENPPPGVAQQFYDNYLRLTLSVVYQMTRRVDELAFICETNFPKYVEPVKLLEAKETDSAKLWRNFEPHLRRSVGQLAIKGVSDAEVADELPFCGKYLLIAAYLASYNSAKSDRRFFLRNQGRLRTRRRVGLSKKEKLVEGPKAFPLERLLHIYKALLELNCDHEDEWLQLKEPSNQLLFQVENLAALRLLIKVQSNSVGSCLSSNRKYKVADSVSLDYMTIVANTVRFDLMAHLEQFAYKQ